MIEQNNPADHDEAQIADLISRIDKLLLEDDDDDDMPEADLEYASAQLLSGLQELSLVDAPDDLEWEHFILIATATFEPALDRNLSATEQAVREIRLSDPQIIAAINARHEQTGRLRLPVLRLERSNLGTTARLVNLPVAAESLRFRIMINDVVIDVVAVDGEYRGASTASVDPTSFSTAPISVSVLRR